MYFAAHLLVGIVACFNISKKKIVAFVVGWTNLNEMAVMTWKYSS